MQQYIPDFAYVVASPAELTPSDVNDLELYWAGALAPGQKLSANLDLSKAASSQFALVEFYPYVDMADARALVLQAQLQIQDNPDLLDHHLLVSGSVSGIASLANSDEVAYIFPAADELIQGVPMNACAGALTEQGLVGQSVAKVGGWGGPGLHAVDLFYGFAGLTDKLPSDTAKSELARALTEWAKYAKLTFTQTGELSGNQTISVLFGKGDHGDAYPFTNTVVLAHTFYPSPVNPEPIAGDMHLNGDVNWHAGADVDLFSVALHEAGHALGLGHSDQPGAVMYPYYRRADGLTQEDIAAILSLYTAQDNASVPAPLLLTVQDPGTQTTAATLTLSGATSGGSGTVQVAWSSSTGGAGLADGSTTWSASGIPLVIGPNTITVTATDSQSIKVTSTVRITRQQSVVTPPSTPVVTILSPAPGYAATSPSVTLSGSASDASGISKVGWTTSRGRAGMANGTTNWSSGAIALDTGSTVITITADAQSGATASQTLTVSYTPPYCTFADKLIRKPCPDRSFAQF